MTNSRQWGQNVRFSSDRLARTGMIATGAFVLSFGVWGAMAPLAGAAVSPGVVAAAGHNQKIQHLEGGIVETVLVHEGERVKEGQVLLTLDRTAAEAQRDRLKKQVLALNARAARLVAERDGLKAVAFPQTLRDTASADGLEAILGEQQQEFAARLERYRQESVILRQRVNALDEQIEGLSAQQTAVESQLAIVTDESQRKKKLLDKGLTNRSEYTSLLRSEADLVGVLGQGKSGILGARTQIVEANEQLSRLLTQRVETAASQLNDVRSDISSAEEGLRTAEDVLGRMEVRAPSDGVVVSMTYNFKGSVIRPGESVLELLPTGKGLVVEARVSPRDIDSVAVGKPAKLRFSSLNSRTTPTVSGVVSYVSADRLIDERSQQPYYIARMRIADPLPTELTSAQIFPGMPVETYINTSDRTFLEYLGKPLADSFYRAFREE